MWRTIWKGMWSHKRRLVGTTMAVVLGVAFLAASLITGDTMTAGFDGLFREANAGIDVVARNSTEIGTGDDRVRGTIDASVANLVGDVEGVAAVAPLVEGSARIVGAHGDPIGGDGPPTTASNWLGNSPLNSWTLVEGHAPTDVAPGDPYEIVIDRAAAETGDLHVGDLTTVLAPAPVEVTIVGLATIGGADSLGPTTFTAFTADAATELVGQPGRLTAILVAADDGVSQTELRSRIADTLPAGDEAVTGTELTDEMLADIEGEFLGMFKTILLAFAGIALVVAAFSINNTFSILIAQRSRESALLRALGASKRQVMNSVVVEALAVGAIASAIGIAAGYGLAIALKALMDANGLDLGTGGVVLGSTTVMIAAGIGVGATLLSSVMPAIRASRTSPLAALRDAAVDTTGSSRTRLVAGLALTAIGIVTVITATNSDAALARAGLGSLAMIVGAVVLGPVAARPAAAVLGLLPRTLRGQTGRLARRNAMRDPRRTAASASALMVGTAVVALFTTFGASIKATITDVVDQDFGGDLVVLTDDFSGAGMSLAVAAEIDALPEVERAVGMGNGIMLVDGETVDPSITDPTEFDELLDLDVVDGAIDDVVDGHIAISQSYADEHALTVGSTVDAQFADGTTTVFTVGAVYASAINAGDMIITPSDWAPHADQQGDVVVLVDLADGVSETDGADAVTAVTARNGAPDPQTRSEYIDSMGAEVDQMLIFVYAMLGLAVVIALMGIANTLSLSIHERTRELGLLRAIGQTRRDVRSTIRWESVIVALFGTLGGIGLGTFLGWGLLRALAAQEGFGIVAFPVTSLAVVLGLAALAGVVAAWRPSARAGRLDILSAIATD
ncbi:MAG: FtsX-like permease family protein [Ilumatobacteraceae bacterium]